MDQRPSLALAAVAAISVYTLRRHERTPKTAFLAPPLLALVLRLAVGSYLQFVTLYGLTLLGLTITYRAFGNPLNRYPGPFLARFTGLWMIKRAWNGDFAQLTKELHEKYGDYVRIGPDELSIRDASAISVVYGTPGWQKGDFYGIIPALKRTATSLHDERDVKEHTRRRKTWDIAFSKDALERYQIIVRSTVHAMCDAVLARSKTNGGRVDIRREMMYFTWTIMYKIGYGGHGHDMIEVGPSPAWESIFSAMGSLLRMLITLSAAAWIAPLVSRLPPDPDVVKFSEVTKDQHRRRAADVSMGGDVYETLLSPLQEAGLSPADKQKLDAEAEADSMLLIIAGADTTASALTWLWYYLLSEPEKTTYFELRTQIDRAYEEDHELDSVELARRAPLLDNVINEVLRLRPPVPAGPLQRQAPSGGAVIGKSQQYIPAGTKVLIPQIALSYDDKLFVEPEKFKPGRWSTGDVNREGFIPFSHGPFSCVGKQMAMQEMRHATAALLRRFDLSLAPEFDERHFLENASKDFFTASVVQAVPVIIEERKPK